MNTECISLQCKVYHYRDIIVPLLGCSSCWEAKPEPALRHLQHQTPGNASTSCNSKSVWDSLPVLYYLMINVLAHWNLLTEDDWASAMKKDSSPLHILNPTGFEIQLFKSIVKDDAYLPRYWFFSVASKSDDPYLVHAVFSPTMIL